MSSVSADISLAESKIVEKGIAWGSAGRLTFASIKESAKPHIRNKSVMRRKGLSGSAHVGKIVPHLHFRPPL